MAMQSAFFVTDSVIAVKTRLYGQVSPSNPSCHHPPLWIKHKFKVEHTTYHQKLEPTWIVIWSCIEY